MVGDSSYDKVFSLNAEAINGFSQRCDIVHLDCRGMGIVEKYCHSLSIIDTPFVTICGDDDFIIPSALFKCASFLKENGDYSHAHGKIVTFMERRSSVQPIKWLKEYPQLANEADISERLEAHFSHYTNNFYSLHRTDLLLRNFRMVIKLDIGRGLKERLIAALDILDGKRKMINDLFILRQKGLTGTDENGRRTFDEDPSKENYFEQISFGYDDYFAFLKDTLQCRFMLGLSKVHKILDCVDRDYAKWRAMRTPKPSRWMPNHSLAKMPHQAYRELRNLLLTARTWSGLSGADRNNIKMASSIMREFYASGGKS